MSYKLANSTWTGDWFVNYTKPGDGSFVEVDDCGRVWFINTKFGLYIYDSSGVEIASWNMSSSGNMYDLLLLPNYIIFVSYYNKNKIIVFVS